MRRTFLVITKLVPEMGVSNRKVTRKVGSSLPIAKVETMANANPTYLNRKCIRRLCLIIIWKMELHGRTCLEPYLISIPELTGPTCRMRQSSIKGCDAQWHAVRIHMHVYGGSRRRSCFAILEYATMADYRLVEEDEKYINS